MHKLTWVFFLLGLVACNAQEQLSKEERERKLPPGVEESHHRFISAEGQELADGEMHICPPNWWVGMRHNVVQVMIHVQDVGNAINASTDYPGVKVVAFDLVENPNYIFIDVAIDPGSKPGVVKLKLDFSDGTKSFDFPILKRQDNSDRITGLDASDFIYLLMPDRFANGDVSNDTQPGMNQNIIDRRRMYYRHGGDIQGIVDHLDYIQDLGATAVWPNPLDENDQIYESYHGYAPTAHYLVDSRFGTNEDYKDLGDKLQQRGMKLVKDVIFNHVGDQHWFIRDLPSRDWIHQFEDYTQTTYRAPALTDPYASDYDKNLMSNGWFDNHMPDLNQSHPNLSKFLIQNSIWWVEYAGVDGYRIDTYAYPDQEFMGKWAKAMRTEYPNLGLFAETWVHWVGIQSQFTEETVMREENNYMYATTDFQIYYAINEALTREQGWTEGIARLYFTLAQDRMYKNPYKQVLHLDNHDLSRFYSVIGEDFRKWKCGIDLLMTLRGIPSIYYGTEILMKNFTDPDGKVREDFPGGWTEDKVNKFMAEGRTDQENQAFNYLKNIANYRKNNPVLHQGKLMQFVPQNGVYVFFRYNDDKTVMVIVNTHANPTSLNLDRFRERLLGFEKGINIQDNAEFMLSKPIELQGYHSLVLELE